MSNTVRFTLVLTLACAAAAGGVGGIYLLTEEPIAQKALETERAARTKVLPQAKTFERVGDTPVYAGRDENGSTVGHVAVGEARGYGGKLTVMVGLMRDGTIAEAAVLTHHETPGLGAECAKEVSDDTFWSMCAGNASGVKHSWMDQLRGKRKDDLKIGAGVDARTGCTITSKAIVEAAGTAVKKIEDAKKD